MPVATATRAQSSLREVAAYLVALKPVLATAIGARQSWVRRIGVLMEDARSGNATIVAQAAGKIGRDQIGVFRDSRAALDRLHPPPECLECHAAVESWLDQLVGVCDVLTSVGQSGELSRLRQTQDLLAHSRTYARRFNEDYNRIVDELRARVDDARRARSRQDRRRAMSN